MGLRQFKVNIEIFTFYSRLSKVNFKLYDVYDNSYNIHIAKFQEVKANNKWNLVGNEMQHETYLFSKIMQKMRQGD